MSRRISGANILITALCLIAIAVFAFVLAILFSSITITQDETSFTLKCLYHTEIIAYEDVEEIELSYDYESKRIFSLGGISKAFGTYKNEAYGEHFRLTFSENTYNFILIRRADGSVTVFNQKTKDATATLYENLTEKINRV